MILLFVTFANAQNLKQNNYIIKGEVKGINTGIVKMLSGDNSKVVDSTILENGVFNMHGDVGMPQQRVFQIFTKEGTWSFRAFIDKGNLQFKVDTTNAQHFGKMGNGGWALIWQIEEHGSSLSDIYRKYKEETKEQYFRSVIFSLRDSLQTGNNDQQESITKQIDSIINLAAYNQNIWIGKYVNGHPSSVASAFLLNEHCQDLHQLNRLQLSYLQPMLDKFTGQAKHSIYYRQLEEVAINLEKMEINAQAPDFILLQRDKTKFKLSSLRGNYVLLDFWASWCGPCRKAIPHWKEVYKTYHSKGLQIVSIAHDRDRKDWLQALDKEQMPWIQVVDEFSSDISKGGQVNALYETPFLPYYVLIDKEGKVILVSADEDAITKIIAQIL